MSDETFYSRTFALLALLALFYLLYVILLPFFAPIAWALFIAFLLHPTHGWLTRRLGGRPSWSAALLTFATLLVLIGPLTALGAAFVAQVAELLRYAQDFAAEHKGQDVSDLAEVPVIGPAIAWLQETTGFSLAQLQAYALQGARAVPMSKGERGRLFAHLGAVMRAMVYGTGVTALVQGTLIGIGFAIVGLPSPIVFGVLAALFALVPMAGTPVVWVPAAILLAIQGRYGPAIFMLVWGAIVTTIDNFLRPVLVSGRAQVGTLTVFIGVLGGVSAFGPIGIFLGPLVLALAIALMRFVLEMRAEQTHSG